MHTGWYLWLLQNNYIFSSAVAVAPRLKNQYIILYSGFNRESFTLILAPNAFQLWFTEYCLCKKWLLLFIFQLVRCIINLVRLQNEQWHIFYCYRPVFSLIHSCLVLCTTYCNWQWGMWELKVATLFFTLHLHTNLYPSFFLFFFFSSLNF